MLMEAVKMVCLVLTDRCLIIHSPVPILDWINMKGEALAGTQSEPKVLQWKWFLSEFLNNHKIMAKGKTPLWVGEIASALMVPCPITMSKITQAETIGHWGTERWENSQTNVWFTDGSSMLQSGKLHWESAAWRPMDGQILTDQGTGRSAQHAEVHAARLAIGQSHKEGHKIVRIYSDLWCVCNGIAVWSGKWQPYQLADKWQGHMV
jgi:hypothetical protein